MIKFNSKWLITELYFGSMKKNIVMVKLIINFATVCQHNKSLILIKYEEDSIILLLGFYTLQYAS